MQNGTGFVIRPYSEELSPRMGRNARKSASLDSAFRRFGYFV